MPGRPLPTSVAIIGAGASALFAARRLRQLGIQKITLIEKEEQVGGKCSTYVDSLNPQVKAERGAMVVGPNYGEVLEALKEKEIATSQTLPVKSDTVELMSKTKKLKGIQKVKFILKFIAEIRKFNHLVALYRKSCAHLQPLPKELEEPFGHYAKKHAMENINLFLKPFVTGFGYGDMNDCPTYSVLEYMGYMTIPCLIAQYFGMASCELRCIQGGFQSLMQKMAEDFHVQTSKQITQVLRVNSHVKLFYKNKEGLEESYEAEALILAVSPKHWEQLLGPNHLTPVEKACISHLTYYHYIVVICRLHGYPPHHIYRPEMLNKEKFGHVAFVATLDKRENPHDGRLCSAYINLLPHLNIKPDLNDDSPAMENIVEDLSCLPGVTRVEIVECKVWDDYFSSLPWKLRLRLEKEQYSPATKTLYLGSYILGSFEDVSCVANSAIRVINRCFETTPSGK